jgi:hypothetical protein
MANHPLAERTVTQDVIRDDHKDEMWQTGEKFLEGGANLSFQAAEKADLAKMNKFSADAKMQMIKTQQDWRAQNQDKPLDPEAQQKLNGMFDKILTPYGDQVSLVSRGKWQQHTVALKQAFADDNYQWGVRQSIANAENNINDSMKKNNQIAMQFGRSLDFDNAQKNLVSAQSGIEEFTHGLAADDTRKKITRNFQSDYVKNFVMGMAQTDPDKAEEFIKREDVQKQVGSPEHLEILQGIVAKAKKERTAEKVENYKTNEDDMLKNYVLDPHSVSVPSVEDSLASDKIRPSFANSLKKALLSPKTIDAKTEFSEVESIMSEIVDPKVKSDVIREHIVNAMSSGKITRNDADRLFFSKQQGRDTSVFQDTKRANEPVTLFNHPFKFIWKSINSFWSKDAEASDRVDVLNNVIDRARDQGTNDPAILAKITREEINKKVLQKNPHILNIREGGQVMMDSNGNKATVYPDGSWEEIK